MAAGKKVKALTLMAILKVTLYIVYCGDYSFVCLSGLTLTANLFLFCWALRLAVHHPQGLTSHAVSVRQLLLPHLVNHGA